MAEVKEAPVRKSEAAKEIERRSPLALWESRNPFSLMRGLSTEMDRLFEDFGLRLPAFGPVGGTSAQRPRLIPAEWSPRVDIRERDGHLFVRADLPGMSKDDIKVEIGDDHLTIRGERKEEKKEEHEGCHYSECSYGSFYRAVPLPEGTDASKAIAHFRNGVLEIALPAPKRAETKVRSLEIQDKK